MNKKLSQQFRALSLEVKFWLFLSGVFSAIWLIFGFYQSHYQVALNILGGDGAATYFGLPKEGRGDEWSTYIPILKQAYLEGFPSVSGLAPYNENLKWFIHIPKSDWSLIFLPNQWLYFIFSGSFALSFQGLYYNLLFVGSLVWLLRNLSVPLKIAVPASLMLLFSQFYQVWWTSNFPALGASMLPFAILTSGLRRPIKYVFLAYAITHMLFGQTYPAFYYPLALGLMPVVLAVRRDLISFVDIGCMVLAAITACILYLSYDYAYIEAVSGTTYPGLRVSTGGGSSWSTIFGAIFPVMDATARSDVGLSYYELAMAGTVLPALGLAVFFSKKPTRDDRLLLTVSALLLAFMCTFAVYAFLPHAFARATGLFLVPGRRMQFGISICVFVVACIFISRRYAQANSWLYLPILLACAFATWLIGYRNDDLTNVPWIKWYFLSAAIFATFGMGVDYWHKQRNIIAGPMALMFPLWGMAFFHIFSFGMFNPVMNASAILNPVRSQLTRDWADLYNYNDRRPFAIVGNYGHLLRGEGLPAMEAIHLKNVEDDTYASIYPRFNPSAREALFNQFRGLLFENRLDVDASGLTARLPLMDYGARTQISATKDVSIAPYGSTGNIRIDAVQRRTISEFDVLWSTQLDKGVGLNVPLYIRADCSIRQVNAVRYPVDSTPDSGSVAARGISGQVSVFAANESDASACVEGAVIFADDGSAAQVRIAEVYAADWRESAVWTGKACDLSGESPIRVERGDVTRLQGYMVDTGDRTPSVVWLVFVQGESVFRVRAEVGRERSDVAEYFGVPGLVNSGFEAMLDVKLPTGSYSVNLLADDTGSGMHFCETGKVLDVVTMSR